MMKFLRISGIFLFVVLAVVILLSLFAPTRQHVERSIVIESTPAHIYSQLSRLENFNKWLVWNHHDSSIKVTMPEMDGTIGSESTWKGDPDISGEGQIIITSLALNKKIDYDIHFLSPEKADAKSTFKLEPLANGTRLVWEFDLLVPRPKNIFNLFSSLDKKMGKDFDEGILLIKSSLEKKPATVQKEYQIKMLNFPATRFAMVRQKLAKSDMLSFFSAHVPLIRAEAEKNNTVAAQAYGLFYGWDDTSATADVGAALVIHGDKKIDNPIIETIDLPASKALFVDYTGPYTGFPEVYNSISHYLKANDLKPKTPTIEEYLVGPMDEKDPGKWQTRIIFLVE